jgi:hypothetical protein
MEAFFMQSPAANNAQGSFSNLKKEYASDEMSLP